MPTSDLPWTVELEQGPRARKTITIVAARGIVARIGDTTMPGAMDDAELIVRAVNAHAGLVQELERAQEDVCSLHCPSVWKTADGRPPHSARCQAIAAALAKVRA